jgi:hypothetical protein
MSRILETPASGSIRVFLGMKSTFAIMQPPKSHVLWRFRQCKKRIMRNFLYWLDTYYTVTEATGCYTQLHGSRQGWGILSEVFMGIGIVDSVVGVAYG